MENSQNLSTALLKFSLFKGLEGDPAALEELSRIVKPETFEVRDMIIDEKKSDSRMFFLVSGQVLINKMDAMGQIVTIGKADAAVHPYFGESILLGKFKKSANVIAHTRCHCLSLAAKDFDAFLQTHPSAVAAVYRNLASILFDRLAKANQDLMIQGLMAKN